MDRTTQSETNGSQGEPENPDRRAALKKVAFHSAVTAPAMLALLRSEKAIAQSGGGGGGGGPDIT